MNRILHLIGALGISLPLLAGETAVFQSGFRLHIDRHETDGDTMRLIRQDGVTEMPAVQVVRFDADEPAAVAPVDPVAQAAAPASATTPTPESPGELAAEAARRYELPEAFVKSVMKAESDFIATAVSVKGAIGLMQLMPDTARELGVNPRDPAQNADAGARYLRDLLVRYQDNPRQVLLALAAYNAGPEAVERYHGVPPFAETHDYILRVLKAWNPGKTSP